MNRRRLNLTTTALIICALLALVVSGTARAQQQPEPVPVSVFALTGTLSQAVDQAFANWFTTNNGQVYGIAGETPDVENHIEICREAGETTKVWGTLFPAGRLSGSPEIVASQLECPTLLAQGSGGQQPDSSRAAVIATVPLANIRSGPGQNYPVIGTLSQNSTCPIIGRDADPALWWQIRCESGLVGWISNTVVATTGNVAFLPIVVSPPPPLQPAATAAPVPPPTPTPGPNCFSPVDNRAQGDWEATYWNNVSLSGNPAAQRLEPRTPYPLDRDWGQGSPIPGCVNNDNFSARWRANYYFDAGNFTFKARADDGVRVYLDGHLIIDAWNDGFKEVQNTFFGVGAGSHEVTVEYYERGGDAFLRVFWWRESGSTSQPGDEYGSTDE
jgi:hypothetical protein